MNLPQKTLSYGNRRTAVTLAWALIHVFALASRSNAQNSTSSSEARIEGQISNADGQALTGATVWLEQIVDASALEETTGADGKYSFTLTKGGSFRLKVVKDGFRDLAVDPLPIADGERKHLDLHLQISGENANENKSSSAGKSPEFSDEPKYAVAGVTDWSNV